VVSAAARLIAAPAHATFGSGRCLVVMPKRKPGELPVRHLTVLLLKDNVEIPSQALKQPDSLKRIDLSPTSGVDGVVYLRATRQTVPPWVAFLEEGTIEPLPHLANASTAAVLFLRSEARRFAYCFGRGRAFLRPDAIDFGFGLKVALNAVDSDKLRSLDSRTFEQLTFQTRRQASSATALRSFGIDVTADLLRSVTGEPRDKTFALRVTGRDALVIDARVTFAGLQAQARTLMELRESTAYRTDFDWVDDLQSVKSPPLIDALQQDLVKRLREHDTTGMHLAVPGVVDYEDVLGYTFDITRDAEPRSDPEVSDYLDALRGGPESVGLAMLKRHRVQLYTADYAEPVSDWPVYKGLVVETELEGRAYVLSEGEWYVVARTLSDSVRAFLEPFGTSTVSLPAARRREDERSYNRRTAAAMQWILADRETVRPSGARTPLELCDLLTPSRHLIHVKRRTSSSTLSHLFAQAFASAEAFLYDAEFRRAVREKLGPPAASLIPLDAPAPREYEVVFAIIGGPANGWPHSLPFLSKLNFRNSAQRLRRFGYRVSLAHVLRED
jgi:uncharacterized protein (TIGR04141 family)